MQLLLGLQKYYFQIRFSGLSKLLITCFFQTSALSENDHSHSFGLHGESGKSNGKQATVSVKESALCRVSPWGGQLLLLGLQPWSKAGDRSGPHSTKGEILVGEFNIPAFCWLWPIKPRMVPFSLRNLQSACHLSTRRILCFSLYEHDRFWLTFKAQETSFPVWFYAVTFFVSVQRLLGNVTLNKTFYSPSSVIGVTKGLIIEGKMN